MQTFTKHLEFEEVTVMKSKTTLLALATLALILMVGIPTAQAQFSELAKHRELVLRVEVDFSTFDLTPSPGGGGAFYVGGEIFNRGESSADGDEAIGRFDCWGWQVDAVLGPVFVLQEWNLFGVGKIQVQGAEDEGPRAVTGGTGRFNNARGEATGFDFSNLGVDASFVGRFKLKG